MSPFLQCGPELRGQDSGDGDPSARAGRPIPFRRVPVSTIRAADLGNFIKRGEMANKRKSRKGTAMLPILHADAAGIDIGATEIYVAVPADRDHDPVRAFETFTEDLMKLADWLQECRVCTVAMESTGVYWIPLMQILESRGLEVYLVNARYAKNVPGRKTDVADCQWLQYLHSVGLLKASFRPGPDVCAVRSLLRHRESLVQLASQHVQHMQKAFDQMNLQLHHVISDLTGTTGLAIIDAVLSGERDGQKLADLCDPRIRATKDTITRSLVGDYRPEHLFTLKQSLNLYRQYQKEITDCESEIQRFLKRLESKVNPAEKPLPPAKDSVRKCKIMPPVKALSLREEAYRVLGVDLTTVPGLSVLNVQTVIAEVGPDLSRFRSSGAFSSWMGLCPDNAISGGKILRTGTRRVKNRLAAALRIAAQSLQGSQSALGEFYRRMRARLGPPQAITATAHKLARMIYHMITTREPYDESVFARLEVSYRQRTAKRLKAQAQALGFMLVPTSTPLT
jgi:transposase